MKQERVIDLGYRPTARQALFHASAADEVLFGGAAGGGKTLAIVMDALDRCLRKPNTQAYLFRRTYRELDDTLIHTLRQYVKPEIGAYTASARDFRLKNGSIMRFRHCASANDVYKYQGAEIHYLYIDELTHFTAREYEFLKSRLRAKINLGIRPLVRCTSNPGGIGHTWVKQLFIDGGPPGEVQVKSVYSEFLGGARERAVQYIPASVADNPFIGEDYVYELEQKPKALRDALLFGLWSAFEGQVFAEWRDDFRHYGDGLFTHVIAPFEIPAHWKRYRSFDFGYAKPFSVLWWAVGDDSTAYLYREWYGATAPDVGMRIAPDEIARGILEREAGEKIESGFADPSIWDGSRGESVARQMERAGVYFLPAENARLAGKMQLHYRLKFDENGKCGMQVFSNCREFIRVIPALVYDTAHPEDVNTRGEDHAYDAARYFLMERKMAAPVRIVKPRVLSPLEEMVMIVKDFFES